MLPPKKRNNYRISNTNGVSTDPFLCIATPANAQVTMTSSRSTYQGSRKRLVRGSCTRMNPNTSATFQFSRTTRPQHPPSALPSSTHGMASSSSDSEDENLGFVEEAKRSIRPIQDYLQPGCRCEPLIIDEDWRARRLCENCFCFLCGVHASNCEKWKVSANVEDEPSWRAWRLLRRSQRHN